MNAVVHKNAVVLRSTVPSLAGYSGYREYLRFDFWFSCAYCSLTELEASGIGFEIDHFEPQDECQCDVNEYSNLMWSCRTCNRYKSNVWPSKALQDAGYRYVRPDEEDPAEHYEVSAYRLTAVTSAGDWTIEVLNLNRKVLRELRMVRERIYTSGLDIARGLRQLDRVRAESFRPQFRQKFIEAREKVALQSAQLQGEDLSAAIVRVLAHSPCLDPDPQVRSQTTRRKKYLAGIKALVVEKAELDEEEPGSMSTLVMND